jgi:hypothetical protein
MNVDPHKVLTWLFSKHVITNQERVVMHGVTNEQRSYNKEGQFDMAR